MRVKQIVLVVCFAYLVLLIVVCNQNVTAAGRFEIKAEKSSKKQGDYLQIVKSYADALLEHGRDTYGKVNSPLIAATLDRKTLKLFEGKKLEKIRNIPEEDWGIRIQDRVLTGANPMHHQNLYQLLYALTEVTGEKRYAEEADKTLKWFFDHCQSESTDLLAWGEHMGWDFNTETIVNRRQGTYHEFYRPWILWEQSYKLAPEVCEKFARGLWEHQIGNQRTGNFSRHALYDKHGPKLNSAYPRHVGFYIATWAYAYKRTGDQVFLKAIDTLIRHLDSRLYIANYSVDKRKSDPVLLKAIIALVGVYGETVGTQLRQIRPESQSNLSLVIDLWDSADKVPEELANKMLTLAKRNNEVLTKRYRMLDLSNPEALTESAWSNDGYTTRNDATHGLTMVTHYKQTGSEIYRKLALNRADLYLLMDPQELEVSPQSNIGTSINVVVRPGSLGNAISLLIKAYKLTGNKKYIEQADYFAEQALKIFFDDSSPLPKASTIHDHYEAITCSDTLMMALLELYIARNLPEKKFRLIYTDR